MSAYTQSRYQVEFPNGNLLPCEDYNAAVNVIRWSINYYLKLSDKYSLEELLDDWHIRDSRTGRYISYLL